jgi:hypothetical protein
MSPSVALEKEVKMFKLRRTSWRGGWLTLAVVALLAAGGGWAFAATTASNTVIHACAAKRGGALRLASKCNRNERAISWNVQGIPGKNGINGTNGTNGTNGSNGTNGADGTARAYGLVHNTNVTRKKNISSVTNPSPGIFCVTLAAGIDVATTGAVVTPDFSRDTTSFGGDVPQAIAELRSDAPNCPGALEVITGERQIATAGGFVTEVTNVLENQGFFIVVP